MQGLDEIYGAWQADPTPEKLNEVVRALQPTQQVVLRTIGASGDPLIENKAKVFTARAVRSYQPGKGANLKTWTSNQLVQLRRFRRQANAPVKVPDKIQLAGYQLMREEKAFFDEHDREPTLEELSERAKVPVRRIQKVRKTLRAIPSEASFGDVSITGSEPDYDQEAMDAIYRTSDTMDQRLIELVYGYAGHDPMPQNVAGQQLGLEPYQVNRRLRRVKKLILDHRQMLADVHGSA